MVYTLVLQFYRKRRSYFSEQNGGKRDICRWKRDSSSSQVEITKHRFNKDIKKKNFLKDLMNLLETNPHINIASDHSVSSNNSFKSFLNAESFNMVLTLLQLCEAPWFCFRVCCKADVNVWGWCEFSFRGKLKTTFIIKI